MEQLNTIQKRDSLNTVYRDGEAGPGGAHHDYVVSFGGGLPESDGDGVRIQFQRGPRMDPEARKGVCNADTCTLRKLTSLRLYWLSKTTIPITPKNEIKIETRLNKLIIRFKDVSAL